MRIIRLFIICFLVYLSFLCLVQATWKAGMAKIKITPETSMWMAGYAARTGPSKGTLRNLHAKALVLEDQTGQKFVLVTMDLLGFSSEFVDTVREQISRQTGIPGERFLFSASHTHSGPALNRVLEIAYDMSPEELQKVNQYTNRLQTRLSELIISALKDMNPVRLSFGSTTAGFAVNRRVNTDEGYVIGVNRQGPVDHRVPFLVIDDLNGQLQALIFGYSCHNTTLQGGNYHFHSDYAGVAQDWLENRHSEAMAFFLTGTAGDANPYPRGTLELAEEHGKTLASAVDQALTGPLKQIEGPLEIGFRPALLEFAELPDRTRLEKKQKDEDPYVRKHAEFFLRQLDTGNNPPKYISYPIQVLRFGSSLTLVALAGEVVVDYSSILKKELNDPDLWIAAYSNDVSFYVPSRRILAEGGYEAEESMIYYGQPGPFSPGVESAIVKKVSDIYQQLSLQGGTK